MQRNHLILLTIIGIVIVLYLFMSLQWLLGIIAAAVIILIILLSPYVEQLNKSP